MKDEKLKKLLKEWEEKKDKTLGKGRKGVFVDMIEEIMKGERSKKK